METQLLSVLFPAIQCDWHLGSLEISVLSSVVFAGMLSGSALWGTLSDKFGRKPVMFIAAALVAYHGFLGSFSPNIYWIYILRFIVGAGIAGGLQGDVILIEFVPTKYRAAASLTLGGIISCGIFLEILLAWAVIPTLGWRYLLAFTAIPVTLIFLAWPVIPESVRFLLVSGQNEKAMKTLTRVTEMNGSKLPPGTLRAEVVEERGRFTDLFLPEHRRTTIQVICVFAIVTATYYGTSLVTTELIRTHYCEAPMATSAKNHSNDDCRCSPLSSGDYGHIAITALAELLIIPVTIFLAECAGRRRAVAICLTIVSLGYLSLLTCVGSTYGVTAILFVARAFASSASSIMHLYVPEVFPTQIRALGASTGYFAGRIGAMMTPLISQVLLSSSVQAAVTVYAVMCIMASIVALLLPTETKGRRME